MLTLALLLGVGALFQKIDSAVRDEVPRRFSGVVLVAKGKDAVLERAYGAVNDSGARFWIASTGKQFTSAAILKCREKRLLKLSDRIDRFFPDTPSDKRAITIVQ